MREDRKCNLLPATCNALLHAGGTVRR